MKNDTLGVALTKCFYCGDDDKIVMNSLLTSMHAKQVDNMHQKVIDMEPCNKCSGYMEQGIIFIGIDEKKSEPDWNVNPHPRPTYWAPERPQWRKANAHYLNWMPNPYRTAEFYVVTEDFVKRVFDEQAESALEHRWMFVSTDVIKAIGLDKAEASQA